MIKYFLKIFLKIFIPFISIFIIYIILSYNSAIKNAEASYKDILKTYWQLIYKYKSDDLQETLSSFKNFKESEIDDLRISLINISGDVVFDTAISDENISNIENHLSRKEVEVALTGSDYFDIRKSETTNKFSIYYAKKFDDNYILRVISDGDIFHNIYNKAKADVILFLIIFSIFIFIISLYISYKLSIPVIALSKVAKYIENNKESFIMPKIKDKLISNAAFLIYKIHQALIQEKEAIFIEKNILSKIINHIDEAVILLSNENIIIKSNIQAKNLFGDIVIENANLLKESNDYETVAFFYNIINLDNSVIKSILKEKVYEIYVRNIQKYRLIVIRDITDMINYEDFKATLTANIAHEIKTPTAIIMAASETLIKDKDIPEDLEEKFLKKIYSGAIRLNNIISQTLELYRLENIGLIIEEKADIGQIIDNLVLLDTDKKINYNNKMERLYNIDSFHVEMVMTNLINNALKYSKGDIVDVDIYEENSALIIEVSDMGPQISEKEWGRIFERFYTISKSRSNSGFGLGLSIVKHTAFIYQGKAEVHPNNKGGNIFRVTMYEKKDSN